MVANCVKKQAREPAFFIPNDLHLPHRLAHHLEQPPDLQINLKIFFGVTKIFSYAVIREKL
ncbi:hypothetical protein AMR76_17815 [Vibrio furnissii]|uniref:Uncharacterized protein n=1 Tax=Vibrio furnissii TaxID=29494 RepID=A0A0Q2MA13_VIBFU|nr:hypothetical protein AMR76_17815 [Vibrio furnissii]